MEWIKYHEAEKVFDLRTEHSTYQMQVREYDTLVHLYYGSPVGDALITDRIVCVDRGFSGNPYEAEKDRTFSLDTLPQEYTAYGNGDYRINGLETEQADGSDTANLKFESYEITKGKYSLKGLPAMFAKEDEAETLEIVLPARPRPFLKERLQNEFEKCRFLSARKSSMQYSENKNLQEMPFLFKRNMLQYVVPATRKGWGTHKI